MMIAYYVYVFCETTCYKYLVLAECERNAIYEVKTRYFLNKSYKAIKAYLVDTNITHCHLIMECSYDYNL